MKRKQFLALMLTIALAAGSNMTAVTSIAAVRAAALASDPGEIGRSAGYVSVLTQTAAGTQAEEGGDESGSESAALEKAITDAVGQVSTGAAKEETVYIFTDPLKITGNHT